MTPGFDVVVPTSGRPSLAALLDALGAARGPLPGRVIVVDDRRDAPAPLTPGSPGRLRERVEVLRGPAAGPAAARNAGWRASRSEWVAFLDDDVVPGPDWLERLAADLAAAAPDAAGVQGRLHVPAPAGRRPTDWERNVMGLSGARWATADMAYRRAALRALGGFDPRFPRAFREDADLASRALRAGWRLVLGRREVTHPIRPADPFVSLSLQAGNADDPLMRALHGRHWRAIADVPRGRRPRHLATTALGLLGAAAAALDRPRAARLGLLGFAAGAAELAWARIAPGPRTPREVAFMAATSVAMPPIASAWWLWGVVRLAVRLRAPGPAPERAPEAVLLDRDGTLIVDVPYNGDPARVEAMPGAREALDRLREAGVRLGVVSNQSGVARGVLTLDGVGAVNERVEELLGPLGTWAVCPHGPDDGCACRKPAPGLVLRAAEALGVDPARCAVVGDIGADVEAARAAGARGVLVPTAATRAEEVKEAPEVAPTLPAAADLLLEFAAVVTPQAVPGSPDPGVVSPPGGSAPGTETPASSGRSRLGGRGA
jgi:histidinol-phosphate phosphatase family protein